MSNWLYECPGCGGHGPFMVTALVNCNLTGRGGLTDLDPNSACLLGPGETEAICPDCEACALLGAFEL